MPVTVSGVQYSGMWTLDQATNAKAAGTWPSAPAPHLFTWGNNQQGSLGIGNQINKSSPNQVGTLTDWSIIAAAAYTVGGIKTSGSLWIWGSNDNGQIGNSSVAPASSPVQVGALTNWSALSFGNRFTASVKTDGSLWTWGQNGYGQLGSGLSGPGSYRSSPVQVGALTNWLKISCGRYFAAAIKTDGTL